MKFIRYQTPTGPALGSLKEDGAVYAVAGDMFGAYTVGAKAGEFDSLRILPPVVPPKVIAVGANYRVHIHDESKIPKFPMLFMKPPSALIGHGQPIVLPRPEQFRYGIKHPDLIPNALGGIDYEGELVIVMGKRCRNVSEQSALSYVLGYTCGNDVSARALQEAEMATGVLLMSKGLDTFAPLGPCVATDLDPGNLGLRCRLNGQESYRCHTRDLLFGVAALVTYISQGVTLEPGDCIYTGTASGGALQPGDTIEVDIDGIGTLRNPV
ncbi:MAG: fumarylacetoacetate hydrolase family protein, partial [Actinobacteria bacterium]|nr:fumarylacetoacetate hydrolase family protein [Actinomycetota bacterium]